MKKKNKVFFTSKIKIPIITLILFILLLSLKRNFFPGIIFFDGILTILIITIFMIIFFIFNESNHIKKDVKIYLVIISSLLVLLFHTTVISIVDRSVSIFIMNEIKNKNPDQNMIKKSFIKNFTEGSVDKRLNEQKIMGNIYEINNKIFLSNKGEIFYSFFYFIKILFKTDDIILNKKSKD